MPEIGFTTTTPGFTSVFIDMEPIGVIRRGAYGETSFIPGKNRRPLSADALRAIAVKIEMSKANHG